MDNAGKNILLLAPGSPVDKNACEIMSSHGYNIITVTSLPEIMKVYNLKEFDLAIIGIGTEKENLADYSTCIRSICNAPVMFILPADTDPVYLNQVKTCGDDFLLLPVRNEELVMRSEMLISCFSRNKGRSGKIYIGSMRFDFKNQELQTVKESINLTRTEAQLLHLLCINRNRILPRETALEFIWGENDYFKSRSMDVYVARLRKYFQHDDAVSISNIHNVGFRLNITNTPDGEKRITTT